MDHTRLEELLEGIRTVTVAVVGDFCLDAYWIGDMTRSHLSRETPHFPLPIVEESYSPGGAGNVAWNAKDLGASRVLALTLFGPDWRAYALRRALIERGVDVSSVIEMEDWTTPCYAKPYRRGYQFEQEDPRLDFQNWAWPSPSAEEALIRALDRCFPECDALIVTDQMPFGVVSERVRQHLSELGEAHPEKPILVDSRYRMGAFDHVILKPNEMEAAQAIGLRDVKSYEADRQRIERCGLDLSERTDRPVFVTIGEHGIVVVENGQARRAATRPAEPPIDIVGAGDTTISALASGLGAGATCFEAAELANLAASVTVKKLRQTGTATPEEIVRVFEERS